MKNIKKYMFILAVFILIVANNMTTTVYSALMPNKMYTVTYSEELKPEQYKDSKNNSNGIAVEILNLLSTDARISLNYVPNSKNEITDFNIVNLKHEVDESIYTSKTEPFYNMTLSLVGKLNHNENDTINLGILDYSSITDENILSIIPNTNITYFQNQEDLLNALLNQEIDFIFSDSTTVYEFVNSEKGLDYQIYPITLKVPLYIYVYNNLSDDTATHLNELIENLDKKSISDTVLSYSTNMLDNMTFVEKLDFYNYTSLFNTYAYIVGFICIFLVALLLYYKKYLNKITFYDKVTGTLTEYKFNLEVSKHLKKANEKEYSIVAIDIDNFQYINEIYDFDTGTDILVRFGKYLEAHYPDAVCMSRVHSDNFLIFIKHEDYLNDNDLNSLSFDEENFEKVLGDSCHFYTSTGIYNIKDVTSPLATMVGCVNLARVSGKSTYGNTSIIFTEDMEKKRNTQNKILSTMESALPNKEFEVFYQPKISLINKKTCGAEALVRWIVTDGDPIYPDEFIPLFEKNRYITKLDYYVFEEVCIFIDKNKKMLDKKIISVNLSTVTLLQKELLNTLLAILLKHNIDVHKVELEITEGAFVDNFEFITAQIKSLKNAGFSIALDDFGSGISSLNQLKNMELDILKLDKAFLSDSLNQEKGVLIVENVIMLAQKLDLTIVAEGVETEKDVELLTELNCDIAQGYYFERAVKGEQFLEYLVNEEKNKDSE